MPRSAAPSAIVDGARKSPPLTSCSTPSRTNAVGSCSRASALAAAPCSSTALAERLSAVGGGTRREHGVELRQRHLPKLEDASLLAVDRDELAVFPLPAIAAARPHLELVET